MIIKRKYKLLYKIKSSLVCEWNDLLKLSDEQLEYINHYLLHSSFLEACPGSGKTEVIGIKSAFEFQKWNLKGGMAIVTFTTSAAKELSVRIRKFSGDSIDIYPHFVGTFDSWLHNYILQPFAHYLTGYAGKDGDKSIRLVDIDSSAPFLSNYTTLIAKNGRSIPVKVTEYYYDHNNVIHGLNDIIDAMIHGGISIAEATSLKEKKIAFIRAGFATYSDVEYLCNRLLIKFPILQERLAARFPVITVDECQDLSSGQISILESIRSKGTCLHFVGDLNQSIYEFRKVDPNFIQAYINANHFTIKKLTNNYRSCQPIVNVSENIIGSATVITGHEQEVLPPSCILWQYKPANFLLLPSHFDKILSQANLDKTKSVILARGKATLLPMRNQSTKYGWDKVELFALALHCWFKEKRTTDEMESALLHVGRVISLLCYEGKGDGRNQYCPEVMTPVQWRLFLKKFLMQLNSLYPFKEAGIEVTWTQWVGKLKACLQPLWAGFSFTVEWGTITPKLKSPSKRKDEDVSIICSRTGIQNPFRTTTIHSVKGETLSAVLLISHPSKKSQGGHYSQWLRAPGYDPEHVRFAYVACSRPKYLLVVATPELSQGDLQQMIALGFTPQAMPL
jgi:DNA helicase-2/ATP-dependent DNA helicase PcrA